MTQSHVTREEWLNAFVAAARPAFTAQGLTIPDKVRVSIGWSSSGIRSKSIGECWAQVASGDGHSEIFISPKLDDPARITDVLTHELVHAAVGLEAKHGPIFKKAAQAMGLEGKMTATTAGDKWREWALPVLAELGDYPGNTITGRSSTAKPKQTTRMIKATCPVCEFTMRLTKKWICEAGERVFCPMPSHFEEECEGVHIHDGTLMTLETGDEGEGE